MKTTATATLPAADLLPISPGATVWFRLARLAIAPLLHFLFRFEVIWEEAVGPEPLVVIANHSGWLDSFALLLALPSEPRLHFLGNPEGLVQRRMQWWIVRHVGGYIPVNHSRHHDPKLFGYADLCLRKGGRVALFPEGEYDFAEENCEALLPFKKGFAHFALDTGTRILPVSIQGSETLWFRKKIRICIGAPVDTAGHSIEELVALGTEKINHLLHTCPADHGRVRLFSRTLTNLL